MPFPLIYQSLSIPRGGAASKPSKAPARRSQSTPQSPATSSNTGNHHRDRIRAASLSLITLAVFLLAYTQRQVWLPLLNKQRIQQFTLDKLHQLQPDDPSKDWQALLMYATGMAIWEFAGLSTIPVETAAAMVFGWKAALASGSGKLMGAMIAFVLGRSILKNWVQTKLADNTVFALLNESEHSHPEILTAFLMKFSCFPEFVKNFGSSVLSIPFVLFVLATFVHGGMFTLLWTWLGVDASLHLEQPDLPTDRGLQVAMVLAGIVGVVLSPLGMAWWIRDLKRLQAAKKKTSNKRKK